jgi:hypothetical protein
MSRLECLVWKVRRGQEIDDTFDATYAGDFLNFNLPSYAGNTAWPAEMDNEFADQYLSGMQDPNIFDLALLMLGDGYLDFAQMDAEPNLGSSR